MAVSPDGKSAYAANYQGSSNSVSQYNVKSGTGTLSPKTPATVSAGSGPISISISPNGRHAYVLNNYGSNISQYDINPHSGALSPMSPATVATGFNAFTIVLSPDGTSAYVTILGSPGAVGVWQYTIDPSTGALSSKTPTVVATLNPLRIAISQDGGHAYVGDGFSNTVCQYNIDSLTGTLSPMNPATVPSGVYASGVALSPDGKSAYVTNSGDGTVSQYDVNPLTGALSPKSVAPVATGLAPGGITVGRRPMGNR